MEDGLVPAIRECLGNLAESLSEHVAPIKFAGDLVKIASSIPDRILFHKIGLFLDAVPQAKKEQFTKLTANDAASRKKVAEYLVVYLNQMDEVEKAEILAKMFCAYVDREVSLETLRRLAASINGAFIVDLQHLFVSPQSVLAENLGNLVRSGLSRQSGQLRVDHVPIVELTNLGKIFRQVMRNEPISAWRVDPTDGRV